jgi:ectoine hydroxylase-related dioxygenase (phytanoyl-CoA dioxygenase family)
VEAQELLALVERARTTPLDDQGAAKLHAAMNTWVLRHLRGGSSSQRRAAKRPDLFRWTAPICYIASELSEEGASMNTTVQPPLTTSVPAPIGAPRLHPLNTLDDGTKRRTGDGYRVTDEERAFFQRNGFLVLRGVLTEAELAAIDDVFQMFIRGEVRDMGKDFCDMSGGLERSPESFSLINAMLPRVYHPSFQGNVYERRTQDIARQLIGDDVGLDYDQLLAKKPTKSDAVFAWHQDMAYWPKKTPDTRTVTCSLALDDADTENGCLKVVPGSHLAGLRRHFPLAELLKRQGKVQGDSREAAHALVTEIDHGEEILYLPVRRGDTTLHNEWIVHGSDGNRSNRWRRTYVIAYRSLETIRWERSIGFTHSHNDTTNWDTFDAVESR